MKVEEQTVFCISNGMEPIADIRPQNILTFYYIEYYYQKNSDPMDREVMNECLKEITERYLKSFSLLLYRQLDKYSERKRVDKPYIIIQPSVPPTIAELTDYYIKMKTTYRSDMNRRNDKWNDIAGWTLELTRAYYSNNYLAMLPPIDNLNNAIHNTTTKVINKFDNGKELIQALNMKFRARHPSNYKFNVDRRVLRLRLLETVKKVKFNSLIMKAYLQ